MSQIFRRILAGWKDYKYRFSPWLAVNLGRQIERSSQKSLNFILKSENEYTQDLLNLFTDFAPPNILLLYKDNLVRADHFRVLHKFNADILLQKWGFTIEVRPSLILGGGRGVFVTQGRVSQGQIVGLYPGVVYQTGQPIMFQSIQNPYILRYKLQEQFV